VFAPVIIFGWVDFGDRFDPSLSIDDDMAMVSLTLPGLSNNFFQR